MLLDNCAATAAAGRRIVRSESALLEAVHVEHAFLVLNSVFRLRHRNYANILTLERMFGHEQLYM